MDVQATLAANMRKYRKEAGLTQEKLAELCGLHRTYIGGIEQERINVSLNNMNKIAKALGVPVSSLLQESGRYDDGRAMFHADYGLCEFDGNELRVRVADMKDPDLGMQILISLIQSGITDEVELAAEYKKTERTLLDYFNSGNM